MIDVFQPLWLQSPYLLINSNSKFKFKPYSFIAIDIVAIDLSI